MLAVESTFLSRVREAIWQAPGTEMWKPVRIACGSHAQFHMGSRHALELVFSGQGESARLMVPRVCQQVLLEATWLLTMGLGGCMLFWLHVCGSPT